MDNKVVIVGSVGTICTKLENDILVFDHPKSLMGEYFEKAKIKINAEYKFMFAKHSSEVTKEDRQKLIEYLVRYQYNYSKAMVLYGTNPDSTNETIACLKEVPEIKDKTIIIVGSEYPFGFYNSDAPFQIGKALGILAIANPGIYSVFNF